MRPLLQVWMGLSTELGPGARGVQTFWGSDPPEGWGPADSGLGLSCLLLEVVWAAHRRQAKPVLKSQS